MNRTELETGMLSGKRQTMLSVSGWISEKIRIARASAEKLDSATVLSLTLAALETLKDRMDSQLKNGVDTLDFGDFLPK